MKSIKSGHVVTIPGWTEFSGNAYKSAISNPKKSYGLVPLIYRAMNIRADNLVRVPWEFFQGKQQIEEWPFEESLPFRDMLRLSEMALMGNGKSVCVLNAVEFDGIIASDMAIEWLNPFTVKVKQMQDGSLRFKREVNGVQYPVGSPGWTEEEVYYLREFSFENDVAEGVAPVNVAFEDAKIQRALTSFLSRYFEGGAIPPTIVSIADAAEGETTRLENWFKTKVRGLLERVIGIESKEMEIHQLSSELKDFDIDKLDNHVVQDVANAFGMSPTSLMAGSANRATAEFEDLHLMRTIEARSLFHEHKLNRFLRRWDIKAKSNVQKLPEFQEDEEQRSGALLNLVNAGETLDRAYEILGYEISDDHKKELDARKKAKLEQPQPPAPAPAQLPAQAGTTAAAKSDLRKWMAKAEQRFNEGKAASCVFVSDAIPGEEQQRIRLALSNVKSVDDIRAAFREMN